MGTMTSLIFNPLSLLNCKPLSQTVLISQGLRPNLWIMATSVELSPKYNEIGDKLYCYNMFSLSYGDLHLCMFSVETIFWMFFW